MTLFDRHIAVDWSAANRARTGAESIWIGEAGRDSVNPATRAEAMAIIAARIREGGRVFIGFDFAFGYPRGAARLIAGAADWNALWQAIADRVVDGADNRSNRFDVAAGFNRALGQPHYWGHPPHHRYIDLLPGRPAHGYAGIGEYRLAELRIRGPQPVWKLAGAGSVGSQSLLGIARLQHLRRQFPDIGIWPFETDFEQALRPVTIAEIYPSMFPVTGTIVPRDREQVESCVASFAALDAAGRFGEFLAAPATLSQWQRDMLLREEGWIAGVGHEALLHGLGAAPADYLRDPEIIYDESFAIIRAEADLSGLPRSLHPVAIRMIHACGMVDLAADIEGDPALPHAVRAALAAGAPVLCDSQMVRAGIIRRHLPRGSELVVTLDDPGAAPLAERLGTTRSAAAVELWRERLGGAVVLIGNAPTALFHLLDMLDAGAPRPAAIIATPVGFVGAAESKAALAARAAGIPFVTVHGRRGGTAIAAAALNAILAEAGA